MSNCSIQRMGKSMNAHASGMDIETVTVFIYNNHGDHWNLLAVHGSGKGVLTMRTSSVTVIVTDARNSL